MLITKEQSIPSWILHSLANDMDINCLVGLILKWKLSSLYYDEKSVNQTIGLRL